MQPNIDVAYEIGDAQLLAELPNLGTLPVCAEEAVALLAETVRILLKDTEVRRYPDVVTWAFWCREASVRSRMSVYLGERRRGRGMVFSVTNPYAAGEGIDYSRFFERFYREDASHNSEKAGYGIGLTIAAEIVSYLKGKLAVRYKDGAITFEAALK